VTEGTGGHGGDCGGFVPCGIVTLLTDFGSRDPFVGVMKGRILGTCPHARIVDLTHEVTPYRVEEAGFWLARVRRDFPEGTVHLSIVDPGVGTARRMLVLCLDRQLFLGPDNGLLAGLAALPGARVRAVSASVLESLGSSPSATFHGRDLFAPLAGRLATGSLDFESVGTEVRDLVPDAAGAPRRVAGRILGRVLLVDHFGNLFSDIEITPHKLLESSCVRFGGHELPRVRTYGEAARGRCVALVNAFGVVEAACVEGDASRALGLGPGDPVEVELGSRRDV
jgi:hypothetical protein